ncbi:hypothetical protein [Flectobacillus major]|uniref:hypothetical protein n=1 Tax=Flectobacillus major TaxID=103 RepID=UPI0004194C55|nr:hypothetical protein [Flectobacillus major]
MSKIDKNQKQYKEAISSKQTEYSNYIYVFASTLNQMVNYIPWKKYNFKEAFALTVTDNTEFDNEKWNEYLEKVVSQNTEIQCKKAVPIEIEQKKASSIEDIKIKISGQFSNTTDAIFWNITGGQRTFVWAVFQFLQEQTAKGLRKHDRICYLEGNTNRLVIMHPSGVEIEKKNANYDKYEVDESMNIKSALNLMGFDSKQADETSNFLKTFKQFDEMDFYIRKFHPEYKKNKAFRTALTKFNINVSEEQRDNPKNRLKNFDSVIDEIIENTTIFTKDELLKIWKNYETRKAFGYILEDLSAYLILQTLQKEEFKSKVVDMQASVKINATYYNDNSQIDEFDILLLTKSGQIINFECKSGGMSGDNAKSTKYSTYAIAGVYGLPILISPKIDGDTINDDVESAYRAAQKANLKTWCIDTLQTELELKLKQFE